MRIKITQMNVSINNKREPIYRNVKTECCPTCKEPLSLTDALNDGTPCKCGEWWFVLLNPYPSTSLVDDSGWHFEAKKES